MATDDKDNDRTETWDGSGDRPDRPRIERLGHFKIEATLGSGGMGTIYQAYDESMKRPVALKVLHSSLEISQRAQSRFVREAWIAGQLDHPNIVKVYSRGEENKISYLAMELAEGGSLSDLVKSARDSIPSGSDVTGTIDREYINDILGKFVELAGALEHIHSKGFIHRDIKPHNILLSEPDKKFKFTDFGIAHADDMTRMTRAGDFIGTVRYMSPELLTAHRAGIDNRTDIYSLGVTLYEALTLTLPFKAESEEKLIREILAGHYIEARRTNRRIPVDLETVLMKACHHDPDLRYQTAAEFGEDLQRIIDGRPILARRQSAFSKGVKYVRRNYKAAMGIAAGAVIVVGSFMWLYYGMKGTYDNVLFVQKEVPLRPDFRKVSIPSKPILGALSPDGKMIAYPSQGCIWTAPVRGKVDPNVAGAPVKLTEDMGAGGTGDYLCWSGDGEWIAFNGRPGLTKGGSDLTCALFVVRSSGGEPQRVPFDVSQGWYAPNGRISLSPDGNELAFTSYDLELPEPKNRWPSPSECCVYTIPVAGGSAKPLAESGTNQPTFSPNGKKVAYVKGMFTSGLLVQNIWVTDVEGGHPVKVSDFAISDVTSGWWKKDYVGAVNPIWSPDSRMIAFAYVPSEIDRATEIRIARLSEDGTPEGTPLKIDLPYASSPDLAGWSSDNQIGLFMNPGGEAIYTVPISGGNATQITPHSLCTSPVWSTNGQRIFVNYKRTVCFVEAGGGDISELPVETDEPLELDWGYAVALSPDGKLVAFTGRTRGEGKYHIWTVPAVGGEVMQLTTDESADNLSPCWSPDGEHIAFQRWMKESEEEETGNIFIVSKEGGEDRQLTLDSDRLAGFCGMDFSPDGTLIAYASEDSTLRILSLDNRESRVVLKADNRALFHRETRLMGINDITFSPDGQKLAFATKGQVWIVAVEGGTPEKVMTGLDASISHVTWSPDGETLVLAAEEQADREFWLIENFLLPSQPAEPEPPSGPEHKEMTVRMVWSGPETDAYGAPSPDGRCLSYADWETGNLAIRELASGRTRHLTTEGTWRMPMQFAMDSRTSPDGKSVAYSWWEPDSTIALYTIGIDGSAPRVLCSRKNSEIYPKDWSSDGKQIAALCYNYDTGDGTTQLAMVSPEDGSVRILKSLGKEWGKTVCHSPDDKYLAYDYPVAKNSGNFDIFLLATDNRGEVPLVEHPANDKLLGWAPGREEVLFISDRSGTWDAWIVRVADGRPQSSPQIVKRNIGEISSMAFTQDGSYFYSTFTRHFTTCVAPFDLTTGEIHTKLANPILGSNFGAQWSPDGERLAYVTEHFTKAGPGHIDYRAVNIRHMETGEERELASEFYTTFPRWSPDGRFLLAAGYDRSDPQGEDHWQLYKIDVQTEEVTILADHDDDCEGEGRCLFVGEWSGDGTSVFYVNHGSVCRRDIEKDWEERLYRSPDLLRGLKVSPDGKKLICHISDPARQLPADSLGYTRRLMIMSLPNGDVRELLGFDKLRAIQVVGWTPDCKHLLFKRYEDKGISLWKISLEGGDPQKLWQSEKDLRGLSLHPDGKQVAFHTAEMENEIWVIENFLPED